LKIERVLQPSFGGKATTKDSTIGRHDEIKNFVEAGIKRGWSMVRIWI